MQGVNGEKLRARPGQEVSRGRGNGVRFLRRQQAQAPVHLRRRQLNLQQSRQQGGVTAQRALLAERKALQRALGAGAVPGFGRHLHRAEEIGFEAGGHGVEGESVNECEWKALRGRVA